MALDEGSPLLWMLFVIVFRVSDVLFFWFTLEFFANDIYDFLFIFKPYCFSKLAATVVPHHA